MILGADLFFSLMNNLALFIALVCLYGYILVEFRNRSWLRQQVTIGTVFGLFAMICMHAKIPVFQGVIVDQRNAVVILSGIFGGPVAVVITAATTAAYRLYLGGNGMWGGVTGVCLSAGAGLLLSRVPAPFGSWRRAAGSAVLATLIILPGFLMMPHLQDGWNLLKAMALPYGSACFACIFMAGLLLEREKEKQAMEAAFRETKERLDLALSGANEGLWDWDLKTNEVLFDPRYYTLSGYEPGEFPMAFEEWERRIHPEDLPGVLSHVKRYIAEDLAEYNVEFRFLHKNGTYMWIQGKGKIVSHDKAGAPKRFIGTHSDITARKETERSLKITRFSFDTAAAGIYLIDRDARILDVNHHAAQMLGYTADQLREKGIYDLDPEVREVWTEIWDRLCREGKDQFDRFHLHRDGRKIPVEVTTSLFEYEGQQLALSFVKNISRRRESEKQIRRLQNYLSGIVESMPSLLIGVDDGCRPTLCNRRAEAYRAGNPGEITGGHLDQVFPFLLPHLSEVTLSVKTQETRQILKVPFEWEQGRSGYADITIFPLKAEGIDGAMIRIDDVTEKIRMEETLIQNEKMLSIGGLAAGMAHEINNPLAGVIQNAMVLSNRLTDTTIPANVKTAEDLGVRMGTIEAYMSRRRIPEMIRAIREAGARMAAIVDNMLSFARKNEASFSTHAPGELLDTVLALAATDYDLKKHYDFKSVAIEKVYERDLPPVACEKSGIQQVILNILVNGAHAMFDRPGAEGPKFIIRLSHEKAAGMLRIEIEDNGPGMDKATAAKIFDPFFTTKPVGKGTGLGLSISYFIITENHQGTMAVVSEPGEGCNFIIRIPVQRA